MIVNPAKAKIVVKALTDTAIEKFCVLGEDGAREYILRLRETVHDFVEFWGIEEPLEEEFDARVGAVMFDYNQEAV